jgi:hypothetical protein
MQHMKTAKPRISRHDFAHPETDGLDAATMFLVGSVFIIGLMIGWCCEGLFTAINAAAI